MCAVIRWYRKWVSPMLGDHCRYRPTCSGYALEAVESRGAARGLGMAAMRLARCNVFFAGGDDPVPAPARGDGAPRGGSGGPPARAGGAAIHG